MVVFRRGWLLPAALAAGLSCPAGGPLVAAEVAAIPPQTTLRVSVVQFIPSTGDYRSWDALGGEYVVGADGTIFLPTLGAVSVGNLAPQALAAEISSRLQEKLGLVLKPDTSVQVVSYPPIYVVGGVSKPGEYPFRPGMTVLQAVAISGGDGRGGDNAENSQREIITLQATYQKTVNAIARSTALLARLQAELTEAAEITFPPELDPKVPSIGAILEQERVIFRARANELQRQGDSLRELVGLFDGELGVLAEKLTALDDQVKAANQEFQRVTKLVKDGIATVSRQNEIEARLSSLRWDRLDNMIATMRAREGKSQAERDLAKLEDDRRLEVSAAIQAEQANIEQIRLDQATALGQLKQARELPGLLESQAAAMAVSYTIIRQVDGQVSEVPAEESTSLLPGDLVKVTVQMGKTLGPEAARSPALTSG